jgi:tetratricopeptide (TPR) repeat protein
MLGSRETPTPLEIRALLVLGQAQRALGDAVSSVASSEKAVRLATKLVCAFAEEISEARSLSVRAHGELADAYERVGDLKRAAHYRQKAHALAQGGEPGHSSSVA